MSAFHQYPAFGEHKPGDRVRFRTPQGQIRSGRVVFALPTHLTLNCGGPHGTPAVVDENNYVGPVKGRKGEAA